jgi:hypothetical protein
MKENNGHKMEICGGVFPLLQNTETFEFGMIIVSQLTVHSEFLLSKQTEWKVK